uniref:uncharacterized protein LOC117611801 isoform X2 n=1 Tax=Osmia lignaria TaxID=473952 RepID=UPI001478CD64|nr:uncharacterized protein LOC117611801 isoform X2 [Osmia lignaria]
MHCDRGKKCSASHPLPSPQRIRSRAEHPVTRKEIKFRQDQTHLGFYLPTPMSVEGTFEKSKTSHLVGEKNADRHLEDRKNRNGRSVSVTKPRSRRWTR